MSKANEKILRDDVKILNEQLYASYARVVELVEEVRILNKKIASQQDVINALAESASGRDRNSNR